MINLTSPLKYIYDRLDLKFVVDSKRYNELIKAYHLRGTNVNVVESYNRIIFMCDGRLHHNGLTDRLRGILTTYALAKILKRPFYIHWTSPFQLENYLEPNNYDWRISHENINYDIRYSTPLVFNLHPHKSYRKRNILSYLIFAKWLSKKARDKHVYTNFYFPKSKFPRLYKELFRPSHVLLEEINKHLAILGHHYWSFSFRYHRLLGDFRDVIGTPLAPEAAEKLINKNINELKSLVNKLPNGYKCLITSDSQTFLNKVELIDPRIYIVPGTISHIDVDKSSENGWLKLFVDQNLIMGAEKVFLLQTDGMHKSGFAEFAALIGEKKFIYHQF